MLKFGYTRKFLVQLATTADSMIRLLAIFANELLAFFCNFWVTFDPISSGTIVEIFILACFAGKIDSELP